LNRTPPGTPDELLGLEDNVLFQARLSDFSGGADPSYIAKFLATAKAKNKALPVYDISRQPGLKN
jgi:hypothetical protein